MIIITKTMESKSKKQFQHGVRIGFLPATKEINRLGDTEEQISKLEDSSKKSLIDLILNRKKKIEGKR